MGLNVEQLVKQAACAESGEVVRIRAAARLMTLMENEPYRLGELLQVSGLAEQSLGEGKGDGGCGGNSGRISGGVRMVLGVTGSPGAGKSTLTDGLVAEYRGRYPDRRVGVIAVDPSSPFTGGAVLGDRVRMMRHATDGGVFVRSLATRGHLGGLSLGVRGVLHVMGLLGCDVVIIETVGVGQSEVEVANVADITAIIFAPGQGDSIQLLKAGLMEIGDLFVVNKADRMGAEELHAQLLATLKLGTIDVECGGHHGVGVEGKAVSGGGVSGGGHRGGGSGELSGGTSGGISGGGLPEEKVEEEAGASAELSLMRSGARGLPEVCLVSAVENRGVKELVDVLESMALKRRTQWQKRRQERLTQEVKEAVLEHARQQVVQVLGNNGLLGDKIKQVLRGQVSVSELAGQLLREAGARSSDQNGRKP